MPGRMRGLRDELGSCARCSMGAVRAEVFVLNARRSMSVRFILSSNVSETMISK